MSRHIILAAIFFFNLSAFAESVELKKPGYGFRIETDSQKKIIELYNLGSPEPMPDQLTLKLYSGEGRIENVALKLENPVDATGRPFYKGTIQMAPQSVVSVGLQFRIGKKKRVTDFKWVDIGFKK